MNHINEIHITIYMQEPSPSPSYSRKACLADFLDDTDEKPGRNNKYNKHYSNNDNISKNQQEFGHRKRIKP
jgi:hypothetical protein